MISVARLSNHTLHTCVVFLHCEWANGFWGYKRGWTLCCTVYICASCISHWLTITEKLHEKLKRQTLSLFIFDAITLSCRYRYSQEWIVPIKISETKLTVRDHFSTLYIYIYKKNDTPQMWRVALITSILTLTMFHRSSCKCGEWVRDGSNYQIRWIFEKVPKGGGVIFNPKIYIAKFGPLKGLFQHENDIKGSL